MISAPKKHIHRTDSLDTCKLLYSNPIQSEAEGILLRSRLQAAARRMGFNDTQRQNMVLVAAEMVSNQIKYAGRRGMLQIWQQPGPVLDIVAVDFGPGITNLGQAAEDGYSTARTLGKGLGSIRRLSHESGIYTMRPTGEGNNAPWHGSVFWSRFCPTDRSMFSAQVTHAPAANPDLKVGLFARALSNDRFIGDRIYLERNDQMLRWLHLDGLGHGEFAQQATNDLAGLLFRSAETSQVLNLVDRQLKATRGAVAVLCDLNLNERKVQILGVGDMSAHCFMDGKLQSITFSPGILGKEHKTPQISDLGYEKHCTILTASDGIRRNWKQDSFPGLFNQHPQLIAYVLGNIMGRTTDDQSMCVVHVDQKNIDGDWHGEAK